MNLDRFDGYPGGEERVHPPPTAWERWQEVGFDPAEEVGPVFGSWRHDIVACVLQLEKKDFASSDAAKGLSGRSGDLNSHNATQCSHCSFSLASCTLPSSATGCGRASEPLETFGRHL